MSGSGAIGRRPIGRTWPRSRVGQMGDRARPRGRRSERRRSRTNPRPGKPKCRRFPELRRSGTQSRRTRPAEVESFSALRRLAPETPSIWGGIRARTHRDGDRSMIGVESYDTSAANRGARSKGCIEAWTLSRKSRGSSAPGGNGPASIPFGADTGSAPATRHGARSRGESGGGPFGLGKRRRWDSNPR